MITRALAVCAGVLAGLALGAAQAQTYPLRTIRIISPFAPGGGTDYMARTVGQHLADANKWTVVVENKAGANGTLGLADAARADPSGHDLVIGQTDNLILAPLVTRVTFDSVKDFAPIALLAKTPLVFLVAGKSPHRTFGDVMTAARAGPGTMTVGSSGTNSGTHLTAELLRLKAGMQLRHVPYRGSALALTDLLGGHLDLVGSSIASAIALLRSGDVRALAVSGAARIPSLPDVPTLAEFGISDLDVTIWYGLLGPAGLPDHIKRQLNSEVNKAIQRPDVAAALRAQGLEPAPESPEAFAVVRKRDYELWAGLIGQLGIRRE